MMKFKERLQSVKEWLLGDASDLFFYLLIIVLVNIAASQFYIRSDLTKGDVYSLSPISKELVQGIDAPLTIKVFFSHDLPAPYNSVERYLKDILEEYVRVGGKDFTVTFYDMDDADSKSSASDYGIAPVQIQEIKSDQFQSRSAYLGLAIIYGDGIEVIDQITNSSGLEYRLTTTMQKMVAAVDALHGITGKPMLTLYLSKSLGAFGIKGFDDLEQNVRDAVTQLPPSIRDRIDFRVEDPDAGDIKELSDRYGIQTIHWRASTDQDGKQIPAGNGALDLLLSYGDKSRLIPIGLSQRLFSGYAISGVDNLATRIEETMRALLSNNPAVAYLTGHGELSLADQQQGAAPLQQLLSDMYELKELKTGEDGNLTIPDNVSTLIINGPKTEISEKERYTIDQFLLRGGNLVLFLDPYQVNQPTAYGQPPSYTPIETGLEDQLSAYGIDYKRGYVLDNEAYSQRDPQYGDIKIYWAPLLSGKSLSKESPITKNLGEMITLQSGTFIIPDETENSDDITTKVILSSSQKSWLMDKNIMLNPMGMVPPGDEKLQSYPLALSLEGSFSSAFPAPPKEETTEEEKQALDTASQITTSIAKGRIAVAATSLLTTPQLLDPSSSNSNAAFVHNLVDWSTGNDQVIPMRTKGLGRHKLLSTSPEVRNLIKGIAMGFIPLLIIIAGLFVWRLQRSRRRAIEERFSGGAHHV